MASSVTIAFAVHCLAVSASHAIPDPACHETDIVVLTAAQLRESQLNEALAQVHPQVCVCDPHGSYNGTQPLTHSDVIAAIVNLHKRIPSDASIRDVFKDFVQSELFHLITPGYCG